MEANAENGKPHMKHSLSEMRRLLNRCVCCDPAYEENLLNHGPEWRTRVNIWKNTGLMHLATVALLVKHLDEAQCLLLFWVVG